jgi:hypothetical protein
MRRWRALTGRQAGLGFREVIPSALAFSDASVMGKTIRTAIVGCGTIERRS